MKMLIFGDICPTKENLAHFKNGEVKAIFGDVLPLMSNADIVLANLECALTDSPFPIQKAGPVLHAPIATAATLKNAGFDVLSLANNHIRDCGDAGVMSTIKACEDVGIMTVGAGENITVARQPLFLDLEGKKVAIVSFAEHEFNFATKERAGAATLDVYNDFDRLRILRQQVDLLIVFYHGGIEYHPYPSPMLAKKCHKMADCGADLVLCQHSHCVGSIEHINGSTIVYGQGNSIFGYRDGDDGWNSGMLIMVDLDDSGITVGNQMVCMKSDGLHLMDESKVQQWKETINERNKHLDNERFITDQWQQFCLKNQALNLPLLLGWPRCIIAFNRRLGNCFVKLLYNKKRANITQNMIRCESHVEVVRTILQQYNFD